MNFLGGKVMFLAGLAIGAASSAGYIYNDPFAILQESGYFKNINLAKLKTANSPIDEARAEGDSRNRELDSVEQGLGHTRFEFYSILPELEVVVEKPVFNEPASDIGTMAPPQQSAKAQATQLPDSQPTQTSTTPGPSIASGARADNDLTEQPVRRLQPGEVFFLQAGSFAKPADAERRKVDLLLMGLSANIYAVNVGGVRRYRVHIGPFTDPDQMDDARGRLRANGVKFITLKAR